MKLNPCRAKWVMPLIEQAADRFMVTPEEVLGSGRLSSVAHARQYAVWLARTKFGWSYPELAIVFGLNNTTCRHACVETELRMRSGSLPRETKPAKVIQLRGPQLERPLTPDERLELDERFA